MNAHVFLGTLTIVLCTAGVTTILFQWLRKPVVLGFLFWRSATNLQGHVTAGAQMLVEVLMAQAQKGTAETGEQALQQVRDLLPGIGEPVALRLRKGNPGVGETLADLHVRGLTRAVLLAVAGGEGRGDRTES